MAWGEGERDEKGVRREKCCVVCGEGTSGDYQETWCCTSSNANLLCDYRLHLCTYFWLGEPSLTSYLIAQLSNYLILSLEVLSAPHMQCLAEDLA